MENLVIDKPAAPPRSKTPPGQALRVLVTGGDGYIGNVLAPRLLAEGCDVTVMDAGFYRAAWLYHDGLDRPPVLTRDIRTLAADELCGFDAVIHLAELSNDPLCEHDEGLTMAINHGGSVALARAAKEAGVSRFLYASSCSVYGAAGEEAVTETSPLRPQTAYARCKEMVERDVGAMADETFTPVFLRLATAFGASPRMRFDIVINNLAGLAWTTGKLTLSSDGTPWRPLVHVRDIAEAFVQALTAPRQRVHGQAFNVGADAQNYRIKELAETAATVFPGCAVELGGKSDDGRSYRVSFAKIRRHLPEFDCQWTAERGFRQLRALFEHIDLTAETFNAPPYTRLRQLALLLRTRQVDPQLKWRTHAIL
ncbi:MAG: NAD-dependent epimerase/dehydratase family protein [Reyranellaceae bacterium]